MSYAAKKNGDRVEIYRNGYYERCVTLPDLHAVSCDGEYVGALRSDRAEVYACNDGHFIRCINQKSDSIQISGGMLILQVNGRTGEYSIHSGNLERIYG